MYTWCHIWHPPKACLKKRDTQKQPHSLYFKLNQSIKSIIDKEWLPMYTNLFQK